MLDHLYGWAVVTALLLVLALSIVAEHVRAVRACAETPGEGWDGARRMLPEVEAAQRDVEDALAAPKEAA